MWNFVRVFWPSKPGWRKLALAGGAAGLVVLAFCCGRWGSLSEATAQQPGPGSGDVLPVLNTSSEDGRRPVAYIYNSIPITREDLGEYLIARYGPERVDFLVNRRIIERECLARGIGVSDAEVEAQLVEDLRSMNIVRLEDFVNQVLKRFNKSLFEYKEDVIRPKLLMTKLCRDKVTVTDEEEHKAFEAHYGPKVHCKMIVFPKATPDHVRTETWTRIKDHPEEFDKYAREQPVKEIAATGGDAPPINKHFGDETVETAAFGLKPGEMSAVLGMKDGNGHVILKCIEHLPPDSTHTFANDRLQMHREVFEMKLGQEIQKTFRKLRADADPRVFLRREANANVTYQHTNDLLKAAGAVPRPPAALSGQPAASQPN
jgi:hypothetical protein